MRESVLAEKVVWQGATTENILRSSTEEQHSQTAFSAKTRRAAVLLAGGFVEPVLTAHFRDAPTGSPRLQPKSLAADSLILSNHALRLICRM
jgi:hypothetical protein